MEQQGQQFQMELGLVLPQLEQMGVQLEQLGSFGSKFDRMFDMLSAVAEYMQQLQQQQGQHEPQHQGKKKVVPKPEMLILQDELKLLGCCLGEGTSGAVYTAKYGSEEVAVKTFFLKGATEEELKKVRTLADMSMTSVSRCSVLLSLKVIFHDKGRCGCWVWRCPQPNL
jgi:hypothetical protein